MSCKQKKLSIGLDIGSTTVKAVVCDDGGHVLWRDYQRHESRQVEKTSELLDEIKQKFGREMTFDIAITGSGGAGIAPSIAARFVQEVHAVSLAVEKLHPNVGSVIELGGQDAKIIVFKDLGEGRGKRKLPSMNDKCAGGTGAVIDKIAAKLDLSTADLCSFEYDGVQLHPVAAKCGVFAETDINSLQKSGVPTDQLLASLFDAIVCQNLSVLTRGHTLLPEVILLGGPNSFLTGLTQAWRHHISLLWQSRNVDVPKSQSIEELIVVPDDALYYAALGAVEFIRREGKQGNSSPLKKSLTTKIQVSVGKSRASGVGLAVSEEELAEFQHAYKAAPIIQREFSYGDTVSAFLGLDCGSTSTKAALIDKHGKVIRTCYQLSRGNPIDDTREVIKRLRYAIEQHGAVLKIRGFVTTGYAKDVLKDALGADAAVVETIAHTQAATHFYDDIDVICDVGGQDIKLMVLKNSRIRDFRLNTQCSAGNGYFLQNTAEQLGIEVSEFSERAFKAENYPEFGYGCSVFMQSDIVDFQRQGWNADEILAGLAAVLPKNIWLYVANIPNLPALGRRFLLQGGTQRNLAAVKTQVDFIHSRFEGSGVKPEVMVHQYCAESGAVGAALEARRLMKNSSVCQFIGFDALDNIHYLTHHNKHTVCHFCKNECRRTFIDVRTGHDIVADGSKESRIPIESGRVRVITGNSCERGLVEDVAAMRVIKRGIDKLCLENPNLSELAAKSVWRPVRLQPYKFTPSSFNWLFRARHQRRKLRSKIKIGIPKVLNQYSLNPFFSEYFLALGIQDKNLVYSDFTSEALCRQGAQRAAIDPCFPSKVAIAHVQQLMSGSGKAKSINWIFFPMIDFLADSLIGTQASCACPTVTATPEAVKAAFTKEKNLFEEKNIQFLNPMLTIAEPDLLEQQMLQTFQSLFGLSRSENHFAVQQGLKALEHFNMNLQKEGESVIRMLEHENRIGIVVLGRAYHADPGINHGILEQLQGIGYPVLTQDTLPMQGDLVKQLFAEDIEAGYISDPLEIGDVWKNSYSENTSRKIWAAKFVARHPNLVALELSSFKCGHDAPIYSLIEKIIDTSGTPYFCFKDLDENKPAGSINIRLETIDYFLKRYAEENLSLFKQEEQVTDSSASLVAGSIV